MEKLSEHKARCMATSTYVLGINSPKDKKIILQVLDQIRIIVANLRELGSVDINPIRKYRAQYEKEVNDVISDDTERIWTHLIAIRDNLLLMKEYDQMHVDYIYSTHGVLLVDLIKKNRELRKHEKSN